MSVLNFNQGELYEWIKQSLPPWLWQKVDAAQEYAGGVAVMLDLVRQEIDAWFNASYLLQASGKWLDMHAKDHATSRRSGETDDQLAQRLRRIDNAVTTPAIEAAADGILSASGLDTGARVTSPRRDGAFVRQVMVATGRAYSYVSRGERMRVQANAGATATPPLVASSVVLMLPEGTTASAQASAAEAVRRKKAAGFRLYTETRRTMPSPWAVPTYEAPTMVRWGDLHVWARFDPSVVSASAVASAYLFAAQTPDGELSLRWTAAARTLTLRVRGADVLVSTPTPGVGVGAPTIYEMEAPRELYVECWYRATVGGARSMGIRTALNGCYGYDTVGAAVGPALAAPTDWYWGGHTVLALAGTYPGRWREWYSTIDAPPPSEVRADGVMFGDSVIANRTALAAVGGMIMSPAEARDASAPLVGSLAIAGSTVANQLTAWQGSPWRGAGGVDWVAICAGFESVDAGAGAAAVVADLQALVDDIAAQNPTALIFLMQLPPASTYLGVGKQAVWVAVNDAIAGLAATSVTGVQERVTEHVSALSDGAGDLRPEYDSGDGWNPNNAGRAEMAAALRRKLEYRGLI